MASYDFVDEVKLYMRAGHGGAGAAHFRREKLVPKGGPDGGDGGRGGQIILQGDAQLATLLHLRHKKHIIAENGKDGQGGQRYGAAGRDIVLQVPVGTVVKEVESGKKIAEIEQDGQHIVLMHGGKGGLGNVHFKSANNQAPRYAQTGEPGEEKWVKLELKLLADVGLIGLPNAGKSTLLAAMSAAKPRIGDYPFTTLAPNLGVVGYREGQSFVMADIPGIIEGASLGKGLGSRFLRHIERNAMLLMLIAGDMVDIRQTYGMLMQELQAYSKELLCKQRLVVISKADLLDETAKAKIIHALPAHTPHVFVSALTGQGLTALKDQIWHLLHLHN
jgi:GTP-binding protein